MIKVLTKAVLAIELLAFFLWELFLANIRLARDSVRPLSKLRPGVIAVPLDLRGDWQIAILSNLLTLTPGSLSLDVSPDRGTIYVHAMDARDVEGFRRRVKDGFERRVKELFA